jgi:hypothetical protein
MTKDQSSVDFINAEIEKAELSLKFHQRSLKETKQRLKGLKAVLNELQKVKGRGTAPK